jgi:hypothetical protein
MHCHALMILQAGEKLGRNKEVLRCILAAGDIHHALVYHSLVSWVHALIDLVHNTERSSGQGLESHEVEDCADGALAARLTVRVEEGELFVFTRCGLAKVPMIITRLRCSYRNLTSILIAH